jgi:hypothetical protein
MLFTDSPLFNLIIFGLVAVVIFNLTQKVRRDRKPQSARSLCDTQRKDELELRGKLIIRLDECEKHDDLPEEVCQLYTEARTKFNEVCHSHLDAPTDVGLPESEYDYFAKQFRQIEAILDQGDVLLGKFKNDQL